MSAMLAVVKGDRIHMMADAAIYDYRTGVLTDIVQKVWEMPGGAGCFSMRGSAGLFMPFLAACSEFEYEGLDSFRHVADEVWTLFETWLPAGLGCEVMIAGWSEEFKQGQVLYRTSDHVHEDLPPGCWFLLGERCAFGIDLEDLPDAEDFDPVTHGLPAFERARVYVNDLAWGASEPVMGHGVGGYVLSAVMEPGTAPEGVKLHQWPDEVGRRIEPEGVTLLEVPAVGQAEVQAEVQAGGTS